MKRLCYVSLDPVLAQLKEFRSTHKTRHQLPDNIRRAIIDLVDSGVSRSVIARDLGVNTAQIRRWKEETQGRRPCPVKPRARILQVIPPDPAPTTFHPESTSASGRPAIRMIHESGKLLIEISL